MAGKSGSTIPVCLLEAYETGGLLMNYDQTTGNLNWLHSDDPKTSSALVLIQL